MNIPSKTHLKNIKKLHELWTPPCLFWLNLSRAAAACDAASRQGHHGTATTRTFSMEVGQKGSSRLIRKPQERLVFVYHMREYIYI